MCRPRNIAMRVWQTDRQTDGQTDDGQSDPYVQRCRKVSDMPAKPIKFARVRQKLRKYRSKCPTCSSNVVIVKCANRSNHGRLSVLFFLPYITKRLIDSEYQNRVRPKHRNGTHTPKWQDKHRNGTERRLYIHYSDIFCQFPCYNRLYYVGKAKTKLWNQVWYSEFPLFHTHVHCLQSRINV